MKPKSAVVVKVEGMIIAFYSMDDFAAWVVDIMWRDIDANSD